MSRLDLEPEHYTVEDYQHWEGDWELIEGRPYAMSPACQALYECDVRFSSETIVRPDLLVVCYPPEEANLTRAPS
ncbi:hypothetical protein [Thiofaba sp. EF100]|uniref:hypothetical protein n=1 Tax=Thiofaba sp. EF100 TaxID=3121274 RepID=UPI00322174BB